MRHTVIALIVFALGSTAHAQTEVTVGPVQAGDRLVWNPPEGMTAQTALASEWRVKVDNSAPASATAMLCLGAPVQCAASIPATSASVINLVGAHTVSLTYWDKASNTESQASNTWPITTPQVIPPTTKPPAPSGVRVIRP